MRLVALSSLAAASLALCACDPAGPEPTGSAPGSASAAAIAAASCDAEIYQFLVGGPIEATSQVQYPGRIRVLGADDFVTRDYDPARLTITTRPDDTVGRVFCG